jgi:hypothetical protein
MLRGNYSAFAHAVATLCAVVGGSALASACGSSSATPGFSGPSDSGPGGSDGASVERDGSSSGGSSGSSSSGGILGGDGSLPDGPPTGPADPTTCAEAAQSHSYVGCEFWPTVTVNSVWSIFDFAAVVANAGATPANVTVTGYGGVHQTATVAPNQLAAIYLPWVPALKGPDADECSSAPLPAGSVLQRGGAYHLVSTAPVTVYQFNALEYAGMGGAPGKDWSQCPGTVKACAANFDNPEGCYSFTNDASLLLPATALTGNVRVLGHPTEFGAVAFTSITATTDNTTVTVKVASTGTVLSAAGGGIPMTPGGGTLTLAMNAGDVAQLIAPAQTSAQPASDLGGSLVHADHPVQVTTGSSCIEVPDDAPACDHIEETNFPAETLGKDYFVVQPTGPNRDVVGHQVHIYGNFDNTHLTYLPAAPPNCPSTINAGQVVECGVTISMCPNGLQNDYPCPGYVALEDFEVKGDQPFAVSTFSLGGTIVDPNNMTISREGDPDQSIPTAVDQFRTKYVFLAPNDYSENFAVVIAPTGASVSIDGTPVTAAPTAVGSTGYGVLRVQLGMGNGGAHVLTATSPVGLQVMGYGEYTSYTYPGGSGLAFIAPPPVLQ